MDNEHKPLFECVEELKTKSGDADLLKSCYEKYVDHFEHEQSLFKKSNLYPAEEAYQHINKHDAFLSTMRGLKTPVPSTWIDYASNWLTQHIKNTDFRYKNKMPQPVADPYVWDESYLVHNDRLDDEHKALFKAMQDLSENPDDFDLLNYNRDMFRDHFDYEEKQFMACGEPCHADAHKKKHDVFATDYLRIDEEHTGLFAKIFAVSHHPEDAAIPAYLKKALILIMKRAIL